MGVDDRMLADVARAILDGTPVDWASADSSADEKERVLIDQLRVLASVADLHRNFQLPGPSHALTSADNRGDSLRCWGHLRVLEPIGRGAFGEVYRAWDTRLDREVALKLLPAGSPGAGSRATSIIEEGRLLARVRHPNVVTIYGAERIEDRIGLWMEFVKGRTLAQAVEEDGVFTATKAGEIGIELCHAVAAVHGAGLLHRDIKAQNVMLAGDGRVVLMDFGTGRELGDDSTSLVGTPLYLAPEVLAGGDATVASDIYSVGVLIYHLLTGSYPVRAEDIRALHLAHERDAPDIRVTRPDVSPKLARVIERAIDRRPAHRPASADALASGLGRLMPRPRAVRVAYALAFAAAATIVMGVGLQLRGRDAGTASGESVIAATTPHGAASALRRFDPAVRPAVAVLPLKNLSAEPDSDYFVDGLTDEIIRNLAVIEGLDVRSRTSSFFFKDKPRNLREVAAHLGANLVVEGSVLRSGRRLRINVQLVRVAGDVLLWSARFDRSLEDVFAIQDEISRAIVNELRLTLGRGRRIYDTNPEAYDLHLKARALVDRRGPLNAKKAAAMFEQVIARDAAFAPAYAGLAHAYAWGSIPGAVPFETAYAAMRPAAARALQLDPLLAEAHAAMGAVRSYERAWDDSAKSFRKAIELGPTLTPVYTSYSFLTLRPLGRFAEAELLMQAALRHDPLSLDIWREIAELQFTTGRYADAIGTLERVRAVDPEFPYVDMFLPRALMFGGRLAEALSLIDEVKNAGRPPLPPHYLAHAYVMSDRREDARNLAAVIEGPYAETIFYAALGDIDRAFDALERAAVRGPHRVGLLLTWPETAALRADPRLAAFRKRFGLP